MVSTREQIVEGVQLQHFCQPADHDDDTHHPGNPHRSRRTEQRQQLINQESDQKDIQIILPLHTLKLLQNRL